MWRATVDPGNRWALALGADHAPPTIKIGNGVDAFAALIDDLPTGTVVYLEDPCKEVIVTNGKIENKITQLHTWASFRAILSRRFVVHDLRPEVWQKVHTGHEAEEDPKCRSLAVVQALGWVGPWQTARGGVDGEAVDSAGMYAYLRTVQK